MKPADDMVAKTATETDAKARSANVSVRVQAAAFDATDEAAQLHTGAGDVGAVVTFTGICRSDEGRLAALEIEHYPGMAEAEIGRIADQASARWPLVGLSVVHRHGRIEPGETIVMVCAAARHRSAAFEAASFIMDYLKTSAPFWKREHLADGSVGAWVEARAEDDAAAERWRR